MKNTFKFSAVPTTHGFDCLDCSMSVMGNKPKQHVGQHVCNFKRPSEGRANK